MLNCKVELDCSIKLCDTWFGNVDLEIWSIKWQSPKYLRSDNCVVVKT